MSEKEHKVRTPLFPLYSWVRALLPILAGVPKKDVTHLIRAIHDQTGTPQNPVDWTAPDMWIDERLSGTDRDLAKRIWTESDKLTNPRHIYGAYLYINTYDLLATDKSGLYQLSERGKGLLEDNDADIRYLDDSEGLLAILSILSTKAKAQRSDLVPEWQEFLLEYSKFTAMNPVRDTLRRRILNLVERDFVDREGNYYTISQAGADYLKEAAPTITGPKQTVLKAVTEYNKTQREALRNALGNVAPYRFEHITRDLLEAMGYEDVVVTKESGDKGVDVVANVQFGITTVTEVVQVKRQQGNIGRPILDQLRGALPYHQAIRGTLITLGTISKGCRKGALFPGAAPITLIDGEKLIDLLIEHSIGIKKRPIDIWELDNSFFDTQENGTSLEE